ncbi:MAG: flagellar motor protein MotB [Bryobacteraceae bacterium]|jgi:chemotaxis protein MotB
MPHARPIVVKRQAAHAGRHGGAWKVAYADFVTALMALFIVLWLVNTSKAIQQAVAGYFNDPAGTSRRIGSGREGTGDSFTVNKDNMSELKEALQKAIQRMPAFEKLKNQIEMTITSEGLRIELMETEKGTFFPSGVSDPSEDGKDILTMLAKELGQLPNTISIEGHTDARPYVGGGNYSNWELSADRANAARRTMQQSGLGLRQVTQIRGYADQRLRKLDAPEDPSNRRISLIVHYIDKPEVDEGSGPAAAADAGQTPAPPAAAPRH